MTPDQHAKMIIGDLVLTIARLQSENDALREQLRQDADRSAGAS